MKTRGFWWLLALGLVLRVPGLFVNGMSDDFEFVLDWGADVRTLGLGAALSRNYGAVSFALFGLAAHAAEAIPRFWWLPLKLMEIGFELGIAVALLQLVGPSRRGIVLAAYWLNPWFIWHGSVQGFWEGPHLLLALGACLVLAARPDRDQTWALVGMLLCLSWQAKPQGLVHFALPVGLLLVCGFVRGRRAPLLWYVAGLASCAVVLTAVLWLTGGSILSLWNNFRSSDGDLRPSNGGPGLWRLIVSIYMWTQGFFGEVYVYRLPRPLAGAMVSIALLGAVAILATLFWRLSATAGSRLTHRELYVTLAAGALVMSQFAPLAHINHAYGAMVLLIPLLGPERRLTHLWWMGVAVLWYAHVSKYGMGAGLLPPDAVLTRYGHAEVIAAAVRNTPAFTEPDAILRFQAVINRLIAQLPGPVFVTVIGTLMAVLAIAWTRTFFSTAKSGIMPPLDSLEHNV